MNTIIPLISSGTAGPLGVLHLPRLWQKVTLETANQLDADYPAIGGGYDQMFLDAFGIEKEAFSSFMQSQPTYAQLEAWVLTQTGGSLDPATIESFNASVLGYNHTDDIRKAILTANGIEDDGTLLDAVNLNNLDDWLGFHKQLTQ